ncbi:phosphatase PAP2 family protein [Virgibacillus proomii]|uniref:phosphatase PAP2 family protein n=1 Tax=Virgibacillus proomii TaxID=84407 RepID=UPI001C129886|nr:phosphatase PAP2 family protein [Virgibacillus proomii]MBU5266184.1 phosphatase PAP2 family protein [Virgibacillus proomii]
MNKKMFFIALVSTIIGIWMYQLFHNRIPYIDKWTRSPVEQLENTMVYTIFRWITELGSSTFTTPFVIMMSFVIWWLYRNILPALVISFGTLFTHYFNVAIKQLVERERPSILAAANAEGHSFPSGHAMISIVCYGLTAYFLSQKVNTTKKKRWIVTFFSLLIFLIGMSRYIINVHYLTDVIAGFFIGFLCLNGLIYLYKQLRKKQLFQSRG